MAHGDYSEATPLINTATRTDIPDGTGDDQLATTGRKRAVQALKRARTRLYPDAPVGQTGIDKVCQEIEEGEKSSNRFFWIASFFILNHIIGGAVTLHFLEGWSFYDCFYFCIVTTTTVGYGDITPKSSVAKLYVIYYVIVSIGLVSTMLSYLIGLLLDRQEEVLLAAIVRDRDEDPVSEMRTADGSVDVEEPPSTASINERIMNATKSLDISDYCGLGFAVGFLGLALAVGMLVFMGLENLAPIDAAYATIISASTVGFGDYEPTRNSTKVIMTVWLCFSTIAVGKLVADFTDANVKAKQRDVSRRLLTATMNVESIRNLDMDKDGSVDKCEFLTQMLVRSGKVEQKDLDAILLRFDQLDKNSNGELSAADLETS
ncbi:unnamed protein product [Chondrus crispus]|uniref:EF-hand domain-containing protein n=1 Tax=Chondrus crispus TaxID=2769 RepID=R7QMR7_CHOCR|nr:unnamed protein product [Chondrus crispus]CDF39389.1 unnamed protein product [Chondrus crispus]|eukprot:XP_005719300.1 unnamed protein product [Chondrus crispus]